MSDKPTRKYDPHPGLVALGTRVEVELLTAEGDSEQLACDIVPDDAADFAAGFLGASTPLARAITGRPVGSRLPYRAGDIVEVRILSVARSERRADTGAAAERDAATRDAVNRAEAEDTIRLALTFSSKWGDYDPEPLERDNDNEIAD
jgi:hypothetical protein